MSLDFHRAHPEAYLALKHGLENIAGQVTLRSQVDAAKDGLRKLCADVREQYPIFDILALDVTHFAPVYHENSGQPSLLCLSQTFAIKYKLNTEAEPKDHLGCMVCCKALTGEPDFKIKKVVAQ